MSADAATMVRQAFRELFRRDRDPRYRDVQFETLVDATADGVWVHARYWPAHEPLHVARRMYRHARTYIDHSNLRLAQTAPAELIADLRRAMGLLLSLLFPPLPTFRIRPRDPRRLTSRPK